MKIGWKRNRLFPRRFKNLEREEPDGHGSFHLRKGIYFIAGALAAFIAASESMPPGHRCAPVTDSVHVLSGAL